MDRTRDTEWVLNVRLIRLLGLLQILDAEGGSGSPWRASRTAVAGSCACLLAAAAMAPVNLYCLAGDATAFTFYAGCAVNFAFASYKVAAVAAHSRRIRRCVDVAAGAYMRAHPARYAAATVARWRSRSVRATYAYVTMIACVMLVWAATPRAFPGVAWTVRQADGTRAAYRLNVYNAYPSVSDRTYNGHYEAFYAAELTVFLCYMYGTVLFDVLVISMCLPLSCQLDALCEAVRSLGKLKDYYDVFRSQMLFQMFVSSSSHIVIWFVVTMNFLNVDAEKDTSIFSIKLLSALPMFTVQLLMTCYLFETINEKKDEVIFSLYCSNWTDMDLKSKKLILSVMKVNNANQLKLKVTRTKIVNLEIFLRQFINKGYQLRIQTLISKIARKSNTSLFECITHHINNILYQSGV